MKPPKKRTPEDRLRGLIEYHRTAAKYYRDVNQNRLAEWSEQEVSRLAEQLAKREGAEAADRWE